MNGKAMKLLQMATGWGRISATARELHFFIHGGDDALSAMVELHLAGLCHEPELVVEGSGLRAKLTDRGFHVASQLEPVPAGAIH